MIKLFYYIAFVVASFFFGISLLYSYYYLVEFNSPGRHELLIGHAIGFVYGLTPLLVVLVLGYFKRNIFTKLEIKLPLIPLLILGLSYLIIFIGK